MEDFAVVCGMIRSILRSPGLVRAAAKEGDFFGDELSGGGGCEVAVIGRVVSKLVLVSDNCLRVFVSAEGYVYGLFIWCIRVVPVGGVGSLGGHGIGPDWGACVVSSHLGRIFIVCASI